MEFPQKCIKNRKTLSLFKNSKKQFFCLFKKLKNMKQKFCGKPEKI